jgi:hypothetical protein
VRSFVDADIVREDQIGDIEILAFFTKFSLELPAVPLVTTALKNARFILEAVSPLLFSHNFLLDLAYKP